MCDDLETFFYFTLTYLFRFFFLSFSDFMNYYYLFDYYFFIYYIIGIII